MKKKMIARFIREVESFNRMVRREMDSEIIKSKYMLCQGMRYMLEEVGIEVVVDMHDCDNEVEKIYINGDKYVKNNLSPSFVKVN